MDATRARPVAAIRRGGDCAGDDGRRVLCRFRRRALGVWAVSDIREGLKIGAGVALVFALPIAGVWGVVIFMAWLQKAVGL